MKIASHFYIRISGKNSEFQFRLTERIAESNDEIDQRKRELKVRSLSF